jgi:PST family polysaccharide transporter
VFVKDESDLLLVPIFNSLGFLVVGIIAIIQVKYMFGVSFVIQSRETLLEHLKDGWHIFLSRIYVNIYISSNTFLLGLFTNNLVVGYYSVAAKIIEAITSIFNPVLTAFYPHMSKLFQDSKQRFYILIKRLNITFLVAGAILFSGAFLFGEEIITLVNGSFDDEIIRIYNILIFNILLAAFGPFFTVIFICQDRKSEYLSVVKYTFIINMLVVPLLIYFYSGIGMATASIVVGIFHILTFLFYKLNPGEILEKGE